MTPQRPARSTRWARALAQGAVLTGLALLAVPAVASVRAGTPAAPATAAVHPVTRAATPARPGSEAELRERVRRVPGDWPAWSALGGVELERGRSTGDPTAYAAADAAFRTSLRLRPDDNDAALAGLAAVLAARHDFAGAARQARAALAVNPASPQALAALTDALTELGRPDEALATATTLDAVRPGVASFTRLAYQAELRGQLDRADGLLERAAGEASTPAELAFVRSTQGTVRLGRGDRGGARAAWRAGQMAAPDDVALLLLGARLAWADHDAALALRRYQALVARRPLPAYAAAQADLLDAMGRPGEARTARDVARAGLAVAAAAGSAPEAGDVLFEADHGDPQRAVALAAEVWRRAPSVTAADARAWALHAAGREVEALGYADRALALGGRPATVLAHRGLIRAALGQRRPAIADLHAALATDPSLSPLLASQVRDALADLGVTR